MKKRILSFLVIWIAGLGIFATTTGTVSGGLLAIDSGTNNLYKVSTANAALTLVGNTGVPFICDIQFSPSGTLYGFTAGAGGTSTLYTIDPSTAKATAVGRLGLSFVFEGGLAFSPSGIAYATNNGDQNNAQLFTIDLTTGSATVVGTMNGTRDINGLAYRSDGELIGLDRVSNGLVIIDPTTAAVTPLAAVPSTVGAVGGMTVLNGIGYYCTSGPPASNTLYLFDLFSGASNAIGNFNGVITGGISGLAATVPEPSSIVIVLGSAGVGLLRVIRRRR